MRDDRLLSLDFQTCIANDRNYLTSTSLDRRRSFLPTIGDIGRAKVKKKRKELKSYQEESLRNVFNGKYRGKDNSVRDIGKTIDICSLELSRRTK